METGIIDIMDYEANFSIIVPTFREAKNIPELVKRIAQTDFLGRQFELILVDDNSQDGIVELIADLQKHYPWLKLIVRKGPKSLSASAMEGFEKARFPFLVLMDADLSHPPEKIPAMLAALLEPGVDFVIGSRYIQGGSADEAWPVARKITSRVAAFLAQLLISKRIKDPLSGFFALRKEKLVQARQIQTIGWKIGLELMLKCYCKNIKEIPIHFSERLYGKSKFNFKVAYEYLRHVRHLLLFKLLRALN
jgi:dolichol-phosphate mannosyltransferase